MRKSLTRSLRGSLFVSTFRLVPAALAAVAAFFCVPAAHASIPNQLYRVDIRPKHDYTRITFKLENPPHYTLAALPGNRLRLVVRETGGPLLKKLRRYSDPNIGGLVISRRQGALVATFQVAVGSGWRDITRDGISAITIDVGKSLHPPAPRPYLTGRESIWSGIEKLVRDFDPPMKTDIPFAPTDRQVLRSILGDADQQAFVAAEGALYKGRLSEAEEAFGRFAASQTPARSIALFRLGETYYKLQKYPQALAAFREGERMWPAFLNYNPGVTFYYGDSIARSGDLSAARAMLAALIARLADRKFAPALLVRLGDILTRQGHEQEALALYHTVIENFPDSKARRMALLRLNDRQFLGATPWNYRDLSGSYLAISQQSGDLDLREESFFKNVLLESLHGETGDALRQLVVFQKKFPRGIYGTVTRVMRETLATRAYLETKWDKNAPALIRFAEEHLEYLAGCLAQPAFLKQLTAALEDEGRQVDLIKLYSAMAERQWAAPQEPYLLETVAVNAELLGDWAKAERYERLFLRKYPTHPDARMLMERLGGLYFADSKYNDTKGMLLWLLNKGERAQRPESYYYLGRSLWELNQAPGAVRAMELFLLQGPKADRKLLVDAYYVAVSAKERTGDRKGALRLLEYGIQNSADLRKDQLVYKAGELSLQEGKRQQAKDYFEQITKKSSDADWKKLAQQALASLEPGKTAAR